MFVSFYGFIGLLDLNMIIFSFGLLYENDDVGVCKRLLVSACSIDATIVSVMAGQLIIFVAVGNVASLFIAWIDDKGS